MSLNVTVVGSKDRQLEGLLQAPGANVSSMPLHELGQLANSKGHSPDVLVLDLREQNVIPPALPVFKRQHPSTGVVIVSSRLDPPLMLEAMRAGVNEWVADPVVESELKAAIERVANQRLASLPIGQTFAFLGAKGGVGTTTIAVNVATALMKVTSARTLLVDLHLAHGDAALFLGAEPRFSIVDAIENRHRLDAAFFRGLLARTKAGPDLLASSDRPNVGPVDVVGIGAVLDFAARQYQYLVLDVPRSDSIVLDALEMVSGFTIVANQELATVRSASRVAAALRQRYGAGRVSIVVSRYDKTSEIGQDDVARAVGGSVRHLFPSDYRLAVQALNLGQPLVLGNHSRLAGSYVEFARGLTGLAAERAATTPGGLFGRFGMGRR